jgi:cytochrome c-type biogenesis protein CcsB
MPINEGLATLSDWLFTTATAIYMIAMFFAAAEQAFSRAARAVRKPAQVLVTAGGGGHTVDVPADPEPPRQAGRSKAERIGRMGVALVVLGALMHLSAIVLRGVATNRWPLGNMYEYIGFVTFVAVVAWLVIMSRFPVRRLGGWVLLPIVALMVLDGKVLYTLAAPVQPALQSYWLVIHVTSAASATGILFVPGIASIFYLIKSANQRNPRRLSWVAGKLPAQEALDRAIYRTTIFAFPLFTFAVMCGAIWAEAAWGRFWAWDPKEVASFVAWVIYAAYLHSRATAGWRGNRAAIINVVALSVMVFNLLFVNLVISGLHSYAGVN